MTKQRLQEINEKIDTGTYPVTLNGIELKRFWSWKDFDSFEFEGVKISLEDEKGGEGQGDVYFSVIKVEEKGEISYWMVPGWYSSNSGGELEFENIFQVTPKEKMITVWVDAATGEES